MNAPDASPKIACFGRFEADLRAAELRKQGVRVSLQEQPFQILALLLERRGQLISREELRHHLWSDDTFVDFDRNLNKAVNKLRAALGDSADHPQFIETLHRRGYRFIAPVAFSSADPSEAVPRPASLTVPTDSLGGISPRSAPTPAAGLSLRGRKTRYWQLATVAAALLLCVGIYLGIPLRVAFGSPPSATDNRPSVLVLEFRNLSGNTEEAWLSTALKDWLTTELSAGQRLRTISSESISRMRAELDQAGMDSLGRDSLFRIRKNCGTDYVVVGSYASVGKQTGSQIRLDLRLEDARSGETAAAISETGAEAQLFELVSQAGLNLRAKLGVQAGNAEPRADSSAPNSKQSKNSL